ncbi:MAG: hypothetical protein ABW178_09280 [Pseudoxanthomonas sp.]
MSFANCPLQRIANRLEGRVAMCAQLAIGIITTTTITTLSVRSVVLA